MILLFVFGNFEYPLKIQLFVHIRRHNFFCAPKKEKTKIPDIRKKKIRLSDLKFSIIRICIRGIRQISIHIQIRLAGYPFFGSSVGYGCRYLRITNINHIPTNPNLNLNACFNLTIFSLPCPNHPLTIFSTIAMFIQGYQSNL